MKLKAAIKTVYDSDLVTDLLMGFLLVTVLLGAVKIMLL